MSIYTALIAAAALLILIPGAPLVLLMVLASVLNGILLPFVLLYAMSLVNNKKIMGEYTNPKSYNYISWATVVMLTTLTIFMVITTIIPRI